MSTLRIVFADDQASVREGLVLLLGGLMYLPASGPVIAELAALVAPGGFLALAARTTTRCRFTYHVRSETWCMSAAICCSGEPVRRKLVS